MQISIIKKSDIQEARRFDAEFFKPDYLKLEQKLNKISSTVLFDEIIEILTDGKHGGVTFTNKGVLFLRNNNILNGNIDISDKKFISEEESNESKRAEITTGDILLTTIGTIGESAVVPDTIKKANINQNLVKIRLKEGHSSIFVSNFLNSKYGKFQTERLSTGNVQPLLNYPKMKKIKIPLLSDLFRLQIEKIVKSAHQKQTQSKQLYKEAEEALLKELDLLDYKPEYILSFETTKKETDRAKRFDAEYFQPKYEEIIKKIENYKNGFDIVENQFKQNKTLSKKNEEFYNYIEISDVNISNGEITPSKIKIDKIPANGKRKLFKNDLLISKVRPYRGAISFIDFEEENLLGSGAFTVLQEKTKYKKEVLMIFLKTVFIKELLLRYNCGTSYPVIKDEDILDLKIPLIKSQIQKQIAEKIQESHKLRKESKELLEEAKRKVEEEIEKEAGK